MPPTSINLGDAFSLSMRFDTNLAWSDPTFAADPTVAVYVMPGTARLAVGSYTDNFSVGWTQVTVGLHDNSLDVPGPKDAQIFEFLRLGAPQAAIPIDMGSGFLSQGLYFQLFDPSATARDSDLLSNLRPLSSFPNQRFLMTLFNYDTNLFVEFTATVSESNLSVAPEPASWAMMLGGFGAIGGAMRSRKRVSVRIA